MESEQIHADFLGIKPDEQTYSHLRTIAICAVITSVTGFFVTAIFLFSVYRNILILFRVFSQLSWEQIATMAYFNIVMPGIIFVINFFMIRFAVKAALASRADSSQPLNASLKELKYYMRTLVVHILFVTLTSLYMYLASKFIFGTGSY